MCCEFNIGGWLEPGSEGGKLIGGVFPAREECNKYDLTGACFSLLIMKAIVYSNAR
jgi:hypothetical protein